MKHYPVLEWIIEEKDEHGDIIDVDHSSTLAGFGNRLREALSNPKRFNVGLKRTLQRGRFTYISYAYVMDGELEPVMTGDLSAHTPWSKRTEIQKLLK